MKLNTKHIILLFALIILSSLSLIAENKKKLPQFADLNLKYLTVTWEKKLPYLASPYFSAAPQSLNDGIPVGQLIQPGIDHQKIINFAEEVFKEPAKNRKDKSDSLLICYKGKLVFESYGRKGRVNLPHSQSSITTVYTALALARVIELGYLTVNDLKSPCVKYLTQLDLKKLPKGVESITIEEALTNHSGIRFIKPKKAKVRDKVYLGQKRIQAYLECIQPISPDSK